MNAHRDDLPTVIANQAHLPGLRLPGEYEVEFDPKTGQVTVLDGPEAGTTFVPEQSVVEAMRRAVAPGPETVINESLETYTQTEEKQ